MADTDLLLLSADGTRHIIVFGTPAPQGSKTGYNRGGRVVLVEGSSRRGRESHVAWRQAVATAASDWQRIHNQPLMEGPIAAEFVFWLNKPKSKPSWMRYPAVKPDASKLARSTEDSLTGIIINDDSQIVDLHIVKRYAIGQPPGASITLRPIQERKKTDKTSRKAG